MSQSAELYIWDEPLNYLDVFNHQQLEALILSVKPAMLVIEHDAHFMKKITDKNCLEIIKHLEKVKGILYSNRVCFKCTLSGRGNLNPINHARELKEVFSWLKSRKIVKLQIPAGKATPAPPVGPALGQAGINIMGFTKEFNARTADQAGLIIPVVISVYEDRSFTFITKTPPAAVLLKKAAKSKKVQVNQTKLKLQQFQAIK